MRIWRICRLKWATSAWDGEGARLVGGRWNHRGDRMIYAASSLSLAALETLVHVDIEQLPTDLVAVSALLPDDIAIERWTAAQLPTDWRRYPAPVALRDLGSGWLRTGTGVALAVPSAIIPEEDCLLLNPAHPAFASLRTEEPRAFAFDPRLFA